MTDTISDDKSAMMLHVVTSWNETISSKVVTNRHLFSLPPEMIIAVSRIHLRMNKLKDDGIIKYDNDHYNSDHNYSSISLFYVGLNEFNLIIAAEIRRENDELRTENRPWAWSYYQFTRKYKAVSQSTSETQVLGNVLIIKLVRYQASPDDSMVVSRGSMEALQKLHETLRIKPEFRPLNEEQLNSIHTALSKLGHANLEPRYTSTLKKVLQFLMGQDDSLEIMDGEVENSIKVYSKLLSEVSSSMMSGLLTLVKNGGMNPEEMLIWVSMPLPNQNQRTEKRKFLVPRRGPPPPIKAEKSSFLNPVNFVSKAFRLFSSNEDEQVSATGPVNSLNSLSEEENDFFVITIQLQSTQSYLHKVKMDVVGEEDGRKRKWVDGEMTPIGQFIQTPVSKHRVPQSPRLQPQSSFVHNRSNYASSDPPNVKMVPLYTTARLDPDTKNLFDDDDGWDGEGEKERKKF